MRKPTKEEIQAAEGTTVPDVIAPGLRVLFCGINPSLYTGAVGYHFARPGNRFWPALHAAGITDRRLAPDEAQELLRYGYGITNIVERATAAAAELPDEELIRGKERLRERVLRFRPRCLALLGITVYRIAFGETDVAVGPQEQTFGGARLWVLPNPSGLNAHYKPQDFARLFQELDRGGA